MTSANEFHKALAEAGLEYSNVSWNGFNVFGDEKSIAEVKRLRSIATKVELLEKRLEAALQNTHVRLSPKFPNSY